MVIVSWRLHWISSRWEIFQDYCYVKSIIAFFTLEYFYDPIFTKFSSIALAKEIEFPENPGALEKRVALVPTDVGRLTQAGIKVYVEYGAGEGVGFSDHEYEQNSAMMQTPEQLYRDKEIIIKFKGPSLSSIEDITQKSEVYP